MTSHRTADVPGIQVHPQQIPLFDSLAVERTLSVITLLSFTSLDGFQHGDSAWIPESKTLSI